MHFINMLELWYEINLKSISPFLESIIENIPQKLRKKPNTGGGNIAESFLAKNSAILANSAIWGTPFVLGAYITGIILAKNGDFA
jgi:hypothetical protein